MARLRKVMICGASELAQELKPLARAIGRSIIESTQFQLLTGGLRDRGKGLATVDFEAADGAIRAVRDMKADPAQRIITMLPKSRVKGIKRFRYGNLIEVPKSNFQTRRFAMVLGSDAVIAIGGAKGTKQMIDLAWIAKKPLLPIPCTGGAAEDAWHSYGRELKLSLALTQQEVHTLQTTPLDAPAVARACAAILKRTIRPQCFIAMKMHAHPVANCCETIRQVAKAKCYAPIRADDLVSAGDIVDAIWDAIRAADVVVADLTDYNPNVFYELGISHTLGKPTVLTIFDEAGALPTNIPFNIRTRKILPYGAVESLRTQLQQHLPDAC